MDKISEDLKEAITKGELAKKEINRAVLSNWVHIFLSMAFIATMAVFPYMKSWAQLTATIVIFVFFVIKILVNLYGLFKNKKHQKFVRTSLTTLKALDICSDVSNSSDDLMEKFEKLMEED